MEKFEHEYNAEQIQVLDGLEHVRKRPGMYIGSVSVRGLHHLVYEIVDNSIDEALAGICTHIEVEILPGDIITVRDNGRGIPVGINEQQGLPAVTVVLTVLHAGGKFGGSGYKVSGGLHGVGSSVVNALSEWFEVEVTQDGHIHRQRFERGDPVTDLEIVGDAEGSGTFIKFKADPEVFTETTAYDYATLRTRLREQAFLRRPRSAAGRVELHYLLEDGDYLLLTLARNHHNVGDRADETPVGVQLAYQHLRKRQVFLVDVRHLELREQVLLKRLLLRLPVEEPLSPLVRILVPRYRGGRAELWLVVLF